VPIVNRYNSKAVSKNHSKRLPMATLQRGADQMNSDREGCSVMGIDQGTIGTYPHHHIFKEKQVCLPWNICLNVSLNYTTYILHIGINVNTIISACPCFQQSKKWEMETSKNVFTRNGRKHGNDSSGI
jgi:hypothetical protein